MEIPIGHAGNLIYFPERLFYSRLYNQRVSHAQNARPTYLTPLPDGIQTCLVTLGDATHDKFLLSLVSRYWEYGRYMTDVSPRRLEREGESEGARLDKYGGLCIRRVMEVGSTGG